VFNKFDIVDELNLHESLNLINHKIYKFLNAWWQNFKFCFERSNLYFWYSSDEQI
jgi:hypothetical protein